MSENPFAEPEDNDRTVIRPGTRTQPAPIPPPAAAGPPSLAPAAPPPPSPAGAAADIPYIGVNPLAAVAAPLVELLALLGTGRAVAPPEGVGELRERAVRAVVEFRRSGTALGAGAEQVEAAQYALCAALDDVVLATPWGAASLWASQSLVSTFHQQVRSGEEFFRALSAMQQEPGRWAQALEISYLCLALGFRGRYRLDPRGSSELERVRESVYALIARTRGMAAERELSPRWRGVDAPHRPPKRGVPTWVSGAVAAALLGFGYIGLANAVNDRGDDLTARIARLPPGGAAEIERVAAVVPPSRPPAPPSVPGRPARPDLVERLRQFLAPEIQQGLVTVSGDAQAVTVRIRNRGLFPSGSAAPDASFRPLLDRIGEALRDEPGPVKVLGHTDSQPIRTVRFASNYHLSLARAEAVRDMLSRATGSPARITAEGQADSDPVANNATPEGREANRRIEIVLLRRAG